MCYDIDIIREDSKMSEHGIVEWGKMIARVGLNEYWEAFGSFYRRIHCPDGRVITEYLFSIHHHQHN